MTALCQYPIVGLAPQLGLAAAVCTALFCGMFTPRGSRIPRIIGIAGLALAFVLAALTVPGAQGPLVRVDGLSLAWQYLFFVGALPLALLLGGDDEVPVVLFLGSALGMALLSVASSVLLLFIGLEFMSLPAYLLLARGAPRHAGAREAAAKYFFAGGTAGSLFLLGLALYYGATRSLAFSNVNGAMAEAGVALMGAAALFKIGAFPFHFWLPDAYESADPELAGFLSTSMKSAAVLLLMRVAALAPHSALSRGLPAAGAVTALFGALVALRQTRLQRLLAYSSISHAGNLVLGVGAWAAQGASAAAAAAVYYYLAAYLFMSNGAFLFLRVRGCAERYELRGLSRRDPWAAGLFAALLLALGGIPPTAGFLGKLLVFWEAIKAGLYAPVVGAGIAALTSLGYYLGLVREMYLEEPAEGPLCAPAANAFPEGGRDGALADRRSESSFDRIVLAACAAPASVLGLAPWLAGWFSRLLAP